MVNDDSLNVEDELSKLKERIKKNMEKAEKDLETARNRQQEGIESISRDFGGELDKSNKALFYNNIRYIFLSLLG